MSIVRVHKNKNFTVMSNHHFKEKKMSLKSKGLLSLMLSLPDDWNYSVSGLTSLSKDGKDGVMSALAELEKFGYLQRQRLINEKGQFQGIEYNIYEEPQENPIMEKPILDCPTKAEPILENPSLLNTNPINNLKDKLLKELNTNDLELLELYENYIEMRESNSPLTETGLEKLIKRCKRLSKGNSRLEKVILETALINNWKNVYIPREGEVQEIHREFVQERLKMYGYE